MADVRSSGIDGTPHAPGVGAADGATRLVVGLLIAVLGSAVVLLIAAAREEPSFARGAAHPEIGAMFVGGPSGARADATLVLGGIFGLLQIAFFGGCFALGLRARTGLGPLARPIGAALAAYAAVWIALVVAYARFAAEPAAASLCLGFPSPTALLLFVFWPLPLLFVAIYLRHFDRFVVDERGLAEFRERIAEVRLAEGAPLAAGSRSSASTDRTDPPGPADESDRTDPLDRTDASGRGRDSDLRSGSER